MTYYESYADFDNGVVTHNRARARRQPNLAVIEDESHEILNKSKRKVSTFIGSTSAHGLPRIAKAKRPIYSALWLFLFVACLVVFIYQATQMVAKFQRCEKIVSLQLYHEPLEFPAVTFCNLNPLKNSAAMKVESMEHTLEAFKRALRSVKSKENSASRVRRQSHSSRKAMLLQPVYAPCICKTETSCDVLKTDVQPDNETTVCLCFHNSALEEMVLWPCYTQATWHKRVCNSCNPGTRTCEFVSADHSDTMKEEKSVPCLCVDVIKLCVELDPEIAALNSTEDWKHSLVKAWEMATTTKSPEAAAFDEAQGYGPLTDPIAIQAKGKENMVYATGKLEEKEKEMMVYSSDEFIMRCSFNGGQCSATENFKKIDEPSYGSCFIFDANSTGRPVVHHAGPSYGLKIQVLLNSSDFIATTESAGVRLTVHNLDDQPFPNTKGYSAPTGSISSFGIQVKRYKRLPKPFGDCNKKIPDNYIYEGKNYSVEGCYRSCLQHHVIQVCGCSDPRFPSVNGTVKCSAADPNIRRCVQGATSGDLQLNETTECDCRQPCEELVYKLTSSSSKWPATIDQATDCSPELRPKDCMAFYRNQLALIEVFYEEVTFEELSETEAYGWSNVLADFGGQLGLWMGVSVITCFEFLVFLWEVCVGFCKNTTADKSSKRLLTQKRSRKLNGTDVL